MATGNRSGGSGAPLGRSVNTRETVCEETHVRSAAPWLVAFPRVSIISLIVPVTDNVRQFLPAAKRRQFLPAAKRRVAFAIHQQVPGGNPKRLTIIFSTWMTDWRHLDRSLRPTEPLYRKTALEIHLFTPVVPRTTANPSILQPYDEGVFCGLQGVNGEAVVSDLQLVLDLKPEKGIDSLPIVNLLKP